MSNIGHNPNEYPHAGKRAILMPRSSTTSQQISVKDQIKWMRLYAEQRKIKVIDIIGTAGISASKSWGRIDFDEIIDRKLSVDDFEILIAYDAERFTRAGEVVGTAELNRIRAAGIDVLFSAQEIPDGPYGDQILINQFSAAREQTAARSRTICRGRQSAIEDNRCLASRINPFGVDRLITTPDGRERHVVRQTRQGGQEVYDPITNALIETYLPKRLGDEARYRRQKRDHEQYVPGKEADIETVLWIFDQRFVKGIAVNQIAAKLNRNGVPGIKGGKWGSGAVDGILHQPVYCGLDINNQSSQASYFYCSADGPVQVTKNAKQRAGVEAPGMTIRPKTDWTVIEQPKMKEFLPESIRDIALQYALKRLEQKAENAGKPKRKRAKHNRDSHKDSIYFLSDILVESRTNKPMVGSSIGRYRYYKIKGVNKYPGEERIKPERIRADYIETSTLQAIEQVISDTQGLSEIIRNEAARQRRTATLSERDYERLVTEQKKLDDRCEHIHQHLDVYGEEMTLRLVSENRKQHQEIEERLAAVDRLDDIWGRDMDKKVLTLVKELKAASKWLRGGPRDSGRRLARLMIEQAIVNAETKEFMLTLRVPKSFYDQPEKISLLSSSVYKSGYQAKNSKSLHIKTLHFHWVGKRKGKYLQIEVPDSESEADQVVRVAGGLAVGEGRLGIGGRRLAVAGLRPVQLRLW